jgi:hypothetical protein
VFTESNNELMNLLSNLTGRCEDESLGVLDGEVEPLEDGDGKRCSFASTGLSLSDEIVALDYRDDRSLLDGGRTLETIGEKNSETISRSVPPNIPVFVDTAEKFLVEAHVVKAGLKRFCKQLARPNEGIKLRTYLPSPPRWTRFPHRRHIEGVLCRLVVNIETRKVRNTRSYSVDIVVWVQGGREPIYSASV